MTTSGSAGGVVNAALWQVVCSKVSLNLTSHQKRHPPVLARTAFVRATWPVPRLMNSGALPYGGQLGQCSGPCGSNSVGLSECHAPSVFPTPPSSHPTLIGLLFVPPLASLERDRPPRIVNAKPAAIPRSPTCMSARHRAIWAAGLPSATEHLLVAYVVPSAPLSARSRPPVRSRLAPPATSLQAHFAILASLGGSRGD